MTDDRWSREQQEIDEAAKANPPPTPMCTAQHRDGYACELGHGHVGHHRRTLPEVTKYWWDAVDPTEIEREAEKWAPTSPPKKPGAG
jgi:hypothetical protein